MARKFFISLLFIQLVLLLCAQKKENHDRSINFTPKVRFQENKGQFADFNGQPVPSVYFKVQAMGLDIYITGKGLQYIYHKESDSGSVQWERIEMILEGASILPEKIIKQEESPEKYNFYYAHCPDGVKNISSYGRIIIRDIYPGIDWILYNSNEHGFKYDFKISPGADASQIKLKYKSSEPLSFNNKGDLNLRTSLGILSEMAPYSYKEDDRTMIKSRFVIKNNSKVNDHFETVISFGLPSDKFSFPLVIDPQLVWATFYGGAAMERIKSIETDSVGYLFATGYTNSFNFPTQGSSGYYQGGLSSGSRDVFVLKFDNTGGLVWATFYGGSAFEEANSITTDKQGNVYVTGLTCSTSFPLMSAGTFFQGIHGGGGNGSVGSPSDAFILKFNNSGLRLWATYLGGNGFSDEKGNSVTTDPNGNVVVTGVTASPNFPLLNNGGYFDGSNSSVAGFIMKFDVNANLTWGTYFGDVNVECNSADFDNNGNLFVTGFAGSSGNIPVTNLAGATNLGTSGGEEVFIARFSPSSNLTWCTFYGGSINERGSAIATDQAGNFFVSGTTTSANFPLTSGSGYFQAPPPAGAADAFLLKFNSNCLALWGTCYGAAGSESVSVTDNLAVDKCSNVYMSFDTPSLGMFTYQPCDGGFISSVVNGIDIFLTRFSSDGELEWATYFGGNGADRGAALSVDLSGNLFTAGCWGNAVGGSTYPVINPGLPAFYNGGPNGNEDAYISKFTTMQTVTPHTFSYTSPVCNTGTLAPFKSPSFLGGGTFTSTTGLFLDSITGDINLATSVPGTYTINYSGGKCGCLTGSPLSATIGINKSFSLSVNNATSCSTLPATLIAVPTETGGVFAWPDGESTSSIVVTPTVKSVYTVTVTIGGCTASATGSVSVISQITPTTGFSYPMPLCNNYEPVLPILPPGFAPGGYFVASGDIKVDSLTGKIILKTAAPGMYGITYTVPPNGCVLGANSSVIVTINETGVLSVNPYIKIQPGEKVTIKVSGGESYSWTPQENLSCYDCDNPIASPPQSATYCVSAFFNSCYTATCITIEVLCGNTGDLSVPNAFTPNNDGRNDMFCLQGWSRCNTFFNVMIYNRWGEIIFESNDPDFCWDGKYNGELMNAGVFIYAITASFNNEEKITKKGNITLIR
jgi:gliding motility-associated-like protein